MFAEDVSGGPPLRARVDPDAAGDPDHGDAGPEPPLLVERASSRRRALRTVRRLGPEADLLGVPRGLLLLELGDQLLDLLAVRGVRIELQEPLEAEDRRLVVAEVALALADVEQEVGDRLGVERLLVLVERLVELLQREQLLAALVVPLRGAHRRIVGVGGARGRDAGEADHEEEVERPGHGDFLVLNGSSVSVGSIGPWPGFFRGGRPSVGSIRSRSSGLVVLSSGLVGLVVGLGGLVVGLGGLVGPGRLRRPDDAGLAGQRLADGLVIIGGGLVVGPGRGIVGRRGDLARLERDLELRAARP